jgi:hypothetical protein
MFDTTYVAFRRARELVMLRTRTREATDDYGPVRFVSSNSPPDYCTYYPVRTIESEAEHQHCSLVPHPQPDTCACI